MKHLTLVQRYTISVKKKNRDTNKKMVASFTHTSDARDENIGNEKMLKILEVSFKTVLILSKGQLSLIKKKDDTVIGQNHKVIDIFKQSSKKKIKLFNHQ